MQKASRKKVSASRLLPTRYEMVPVKALRPHPRNPRRGDVEAIRQSIRANQFYGALLVQRSSKRILVGEHRWRAAQLEGLAKIPVFWADLDDEAALRILLADNRDTDLAGYDENLLASALQELSETPLGLGGSGYDDAALAELLEELTKSEFSSAGGAKSESRNLGQPAQQIKPVLYAQEVAVFEQALAATGEMNRGQALIKICKAYLEQQNQGGQFDLPAEGPAAP